MAIGPGFSSPETQAAIAAQAGADPNNPAVTPAEPTPTPAVETPPAAPAAEPTPKPEEGADPQNPAPKEDPKAEPTDLDMSKVTPQTPEEIDAALASAGFSSESIGKELAENDGKLTDETLAALKEKFDPEAVDNTVAEMAKQFAEQKAAAKEEVAAKNTKVTEMNTYIFETLAGGDAAKGQENFKVLSEWAKTNLPKDEIAAVNALLRSGDKAAVRKGLEMAVSKWKAGKEKKMMTGDPAAGAAPAEPEFKPMSKDEFIKEMGTEKYQKDPAYAAAIDAHRKKTIDMGDKMMTPEYSHLRPPI